MHRRQLNSWDFSPIAAILHDMMLCRPSRGEFAKLGTTQAYLIRQATRLWSSSEGLPVSDSLSRLLEAFDCGRLSRRQLLQALGASALAPAALAASPGANKPWVGTPPTPPFESTGWKTVLLDHLSCRVEDQEKEAAYYNALMNWNVRQADGHEVVLDIGDWGAIILRGGYRPSAAEVAAE